MKQKLILFLLMFLPLFLVSCNDEPDGKLSGIWKMTSVDEISYQKDSSGHWVVSYEDRDTYGDNEGSNGLLFKSNNLVQEIDGVLKDGSYDWSGSTFEYKIENGHIYFHELDDADTDGWEDGGKIKISGKVLELTEEEVSSNYKDTRILKYKKV